MTSLVVAGVVRRACRASGSSPASAANSARLSRTTLGASATSARANSARGGAAIDKDRIEHPGQLVLDGGIHRDAGRLAAFAVEGAEIDQKRVGAGDECADFLDRERHRRHAAGGQQHIGGEILRHRIGDAVDAGLARAQALKHSSRGLRQIAGRLIAGTVHLFSLRRHDPDQVRWVGLETASQPGTSRAPHEIAAKYVDRAAGRRKGGLALAR